MRRLRRLIAVARRPESTKARILDSTIFTLGDRVLTLGLTFAVSVIVANYLGVSDFGHLSFAVALVALFGSIVNAGLSGLVVRDLVRKPEERERILGTVIVVRSIAGTLALGALMAVTYLFGTVDGGSKALLAVIAIGTFVRMTDVIEFWFQSESRLRYISIVNVSSGVAGAVMRLGLVVLGGSLIQFAWAVAIEQLIASLLLVLTYTRRAGPITAWKFEARRARAYLRSSWPLILSSVANAINRKADLVLLGALLTSTAVGTYAVAARLSEVWYFVPTAIAAATFPTIVRAKAFSDSLYRERLQQLYGLFIWGAIGLAVVVTIVAGPVIDFFYSAEFSGAAAILVIHVWTAPFLFMGVIFSKWLIVENLLLTSLVRHGFGAALNVGLNLVLIPSHGPKGAAVATLISYASATYFATFFSKRTWPAAVDMTLGFLLPLRMGIQLVRRRRPASVPNP